MVRLIVFLIIAGIVLTMMGTVVGFFSSLAVVAFCAAGLIFLYWLYTKFFSK